MAEDRFIVFVVDDDDSVRASLSLLIESCGYQAVPFKSAEDFLDSGLGENPCCLILDICLPGMSGIKLQENLVRSQNPIPVIFITGHEYFRTEDEAMRLGAAAYLKKPFDEHCLLDAIAHLRRGDPSLVKQTATIFESITQTNNDGFVKSPAAVTPAKPVPE
jgi:FixJ family two-component response regulator